MITEISTRILREVAASLDRSTLSQFNARVRALPKGIAIAILDAEEITSYIHLNGSVSAFRWGAKRGVHVGTMGVFTDAELERVLGDEERGLASALPTYEVVRRGSKLSIERSGGINIIESELFTLRSGQQGIVFRMPVNTDLTNLHLRTIAAGLKESSSREIPEAIRPYQCLVVVCFTMLGWVEIVWSNGKYAVGYHSRGINIGAGDAFDDDEITDAVGLSTRGLVTVGSTYKLKDGEVNCPFERFTTSDGHRCIVFLAPR